MGFPLSAILGLNLFLTRYLLQHLTLRFDFSVGPEQFWLIAIRDVIFTTEKQLFINSASVVLVYSAILLTSSISVIQFEVE